MAAETTGDVSLIQDEDILRKMWQDTEDFGKKKEIRSHMYKIREARLKDFYNTGEEITSSSENKQHSSSSTIRTTSHSTTTGLKGSDLTTHADNLADHSFLSLKSKEIRDSESPTKDSYKIIAETKKLNDRDWNVVESNEASKDGKTHTTSRVATTSGKQDIEGGEMKYAAKSEQKASVFKDGDDKNFTKAVQASSQNVIKQEAAGGDDNSKFYTSSTKTTSSSKFSSEQRSSSDDVKSNMQEFDELQPSKNTRTIVRKIYAEDIPKINDPNTKVTTETHTLPDGSTVTTTRYETKGSTQYKTSSSSTSSSTKQVSSSTEQKATSDVVKSHSIITDDLNRDHNDRTTRSDSISSRKEIHRDESDIRRIQDLELLGRDNRNVKNVEIIIKNQTIPQEQTKTVTTTTEYDRQIPIKDGSTTITTTKIFTIPADQQETRSSSTTTTKKIISSNYDKQQVASTDFLDSERHHVAQTKTRATTTTEDQSLPTRKEITETETVIRKEVTPTKPVTTYPKPSETIEIEIIPITKDELKYEQPERRQPIKPHKGELDERPTPTEGQYDTTYRSDYVPRKISVEVSPTHDAFARSLRSISPDRISKTGSVRSLRTTSTTSLRSSPDRYPNRASRASPSDSTRKVKSPGYPEVTPKKRVSESPEKKPQKQHEDRNTDTITRKKKTSTTTIDNKTETDSTTLTRTQRPAEKPRSRSVSPTSIASDIEFIRHRTDLITDLDADETTKLQRRHTEEFDKLPLTDAATPRKPQKITDKSATLPLPVKPPTKETPQSSQPERTKPKPIRRTDTYEERCKEILGIGEVTKKSPQKSPEKDAPHQDKPKVVKKTSSVQEFPSQIRKSPQKEALGAYPEKPKGDKIKPSVQEFPSQARKSPQKEPLEPYPEKPKGDKRPPSVQEFPSQIKKSPQKEPLEPYPEKPKGDKRPPSVQEFPSQIKKSPQKEPLEPYPEKPKGDKRPPSVQEFPSQIKKSPQKEPLEPYPEKPKGDKRTPSVQEFPSQIRKSPQKEPLEPYPEKPKGDKRTPSVQEFPSQIRKSPQKEPLEPYPEKPKGDKRPPSVQEFSSQIKKSSQKEPLEPYPEKPKGDKRTPSVQEFPSQIRKSPQKEPLEPYPEKPKGDKRTPSVQEFPSQIRKSPQKEPLEPYPEKPKGDKKPSSVQEFPSQIKKSPQKEPLEPYHEKPKGDKRTPSVQEFPSQIRKSPQKEPLEPYPEKPKDDKKPSSIQEFPSQIKKSPQKEPLEPYPDRPRDDKKPSSVQEFPSQIRKSPQKEPLEPYPEKPKDDKKPSSVQEFPSQIKKSPQKEPLEPYPEKPSDARTIPERPIGFKPTVDKPTESITPISKISPEEPFEPMKTLDYPRYYSDDHDSDFDHPLQKGPTKVSLDDLPTIKTDKVSLDDLTTITVTKKPFKEIPEKVSLDDLHPKKSQKLVDNFITKEKIDTEVTLRKYKDDSIHRPKGIPSDTKTKKKPKKITGSESSTSEDEDLDDIEDQIIIDETDDVNLTVTRVTTTESSQQLKSPKKEGTAPQKKISPTNKKRPKSKPDVEDFITVTKAQLQEGESRIPVEEVVQPKKIVRELCKKETPSKTPDIKKKDITIKSKRVIPKESPITNKQPIKKVQDDHHVIKTEYTDQYTTKIKDKRVSKPVTAKTPIKQPEARKPNQETTLHFKVQKIDSTTTSSTTKKGVNVTKIVQIDKKPTAKIPLTYTKKPNDQQPKPKSKIIEPTRNTIPLTKPAITAPAKRHVVSTIINLKPKQKPETVTKTIHKTTVTKTIIAPTKSTRSTPQKVAKPSKLKPSLNGDISTEEEDSDVENITVRTSKNQSGSLKTEKKKKCITTKSILIENAVADQREIIVDLKRSKSSRENTPDQICPYPVSTESDLGTPRYPDRVTEPEDGQYRLKPKRISDIPLDETKDVHDFERVTEIKTDVEATDECLLSVNEKVTKFLSTAEQITKKSLDAKPAPKVERPRLEVDESLKEDECLLSVSDKVNKFIATAEQLASTTTKETVTNKTQKYKEEEVIETNRQLTPKSRTPETDSNRFKTPTDSYTRRPTQDLAEVRKQPIEDDTTPKTSRRLSRDDAKPATSPTGRLRSTETIKKAKALFENFGSDHEVTRQKDILTRPSVFEARKVKQSEVEKKDVRTKLIYDEHQLRRSPSPQHQSAKPKTTRDHSPEGETPHYMLPLDRSVKEHYKSPKENPDDDLGVMEVDRSRGTTPDRNVPHYMLPLDRSLRERSPHKDNVKQLEDIMNRSVTTTHSDDDVKTTTTTTTKFGVTLRRTDSGRMVQSTSRKLSTSSVDEKVTDVDVEEIFDLEYLEKLLEIVVGYDIRRRIRAQIRLIKRAIEDNTLETLIITRRRSPIKETTRIEKQEVSEYQRKTSASEFSIKTKSPSPVRNQREPSPKKPQDRKSKTPESDVVRTTTTTTTKIFQTDLKKPKPVAKTTTEDKPEWVTQRTLRKVSETTPIKKTITSTTTTTTHKSSTRKDGGISKQPIDDITSSYGVGPTDENGTPLFGLKALRAQNKSEKTKVQGTVIRSQFYSENGEEPEGEISVTKFSTDPKDLGQENIVEDKGVASVTTTQKFGYKGTPALKSIANKSKKTSNEETEYKSSSVKVSKIARKGSVKEISQKFLDNAVESLKSERQSSYPKAGLILRTSSFKDSPSNGMELDRSREGSPATQEIHEKVVTRVETTSTTSGGSRKSDTFLSNKSKVTGVQDVISRMKNEAEIEVEETEEDAEARNLLNKFIGSQVLLSGMESQLSKSTGSDTTPAGSVERTTKITTTTTSSDSSKPSSVTCTFTHPITVELLQNIWDEQTLKLLLEQSTDYEDRRIIRTRLREVMAEQEACAELVERATGEDTSISKETGNTVHDGVTNRADDSESDEETEDEEDDDQATVKTDLHNEIRSPPQQKGQQVQQPQPDLIMQTNPLYNRPSEERDTTNNNSENDDYPTQLNEKANRFNSKKLKMKRANTIDIPKPLNYYEDDDDDSDNENLNNRRNSYLALRGPIRIGKLNVEKKVPEFEPKTESDKKFMAFLGKHAENSINTNKTSLWCNQQSAKNSNNSNWTNKFGNIKNNFEKIQTSNSVNSARNFWKSADDAVMAGRAPQFGPKISRQSAKNLQQMFEEKQKQNQNQSNVVTGHLKVDTSKTNKNVTVVTQPNAINKFSHAPMSAFKPVAKKLEFPQHQPQPQQNHHQQNQPQYSSYIKPKPLRIAPPTINSNNTNLQATDNKNTIKPPDSPLYLYSPKQVSPQTTSPTNSAPWNPGKNSGDTAPPPCSRVLSIAAAKFQNMNQERDLPPRKMSKEKIVIPPSLLSQQTQPQDKLTSPYIVKNAQGSTVRKLSGQYDSLGNRDVYNPVNKVYKQKAPLYSDYKQQYVGKTSINSDNQAKSMTYNDTTRSSDTKQHYNTNATLYSDYVGKLAANSDNQAKTMTYNDPTRSSDTRQHYNTNATLYSDYVAKTAINSDNKSRSNDDKQYYSSSTRSSDDYGYTTRSSIDKKDYRDVRRSSESDKQHYGDVRRSSESDKHYVNVIPRSSDHKDQYYLQTPPDNNDMQRYYESSSRLSSDDHQHDRKPPITLSSDDDRRISQTNVVVSDNYDLPPSSDAHDNNLYSDDAPECDASPRLFVPGENYTIQYDSLPHTPVYSAEYAVTQQSYDSPQTEVKPEVDVDYHNRQQQMISRIQQVSPNLREEDESHQYTSNYHFRPQMSPKASKREVDREETEDLFFNETKSPYSKESFKYERQTSQESVKEYTAVSSKVMSGPVSQQAVTVQQNTPRSRDQHDMEYNLKTTLQKLSSYSSDKQAAPKPVLERKSSLKQISSNPPPPLVVYNNVTQKPSLCINDKPLSLELLDVNEKGEQVLTSKFHIPIRRQSENLTTGQSSGGHELSKSESWHQICQNQQIPKKPSPRASPNTRSVLRSKSSHSLAVPKQFEAGMSKTEMLEKKKTMEAYFGAPLAKQDSKKVSSSINRVKTSQKVSTQRQISNGGNAGGLCRSKTLPDIVCLDKLDDTNIDAIFEDLFNSRSTTRTTTYTQDPVTTTSQVTTTRVTSQEPMKKPMSPFAKFRQLDKQNSLNSPPSTPKSPTAGGPLFKFTDPSLTQSANTVKQRLLQWCQMKTKEYENIQLDNFSTSWSDGMAFCALIHHFLPDTFDYTTLNPKNRRHNFTLAFRVAEEKAGIAPLLDVDDMVAIRKPDWKCVFTYVQSIYRRFKDDD